MKKIKLTQNKYALVDDATFDFLNQWKWYARKIKSTGNCYVGRSCKGKTILMHLLIMGKIPKNKNGVDHKDGNGLNNQRENLRFASYIENNQNARRRKDNKSGFKGVCWYQRYGKWRVQASNSKGKVIHLGYFKTFVQAKETYIEFARKHQKEFSRLN